MIRASAGAVVGVVWDDDEDDGMTRPMTMSMTMTARTRRTIVRNSDEVPPTIVVTARTTDGLTLAVRHENVDAVDEYSCSSGGNLPQVLSLSLSELSWWWTLVRLLLLMIVAVVDDCAGVVFMLVLCTVLIWTALLLHQTLCAVCRWSLLLFFFFCCVNLY